MWKQNEAKSQHAILHYIPNPKKHTSFLVIKTEREDANTRNTIQVEAGIVHNVANTIRELNSIASLMCETPRNSS